MTRFGYTWLLLLSLCFSGSSAAPTDPPHRGEQRDAPSDTTDWDQLLDDKLTALYISSNASDADRLKQLKVLMKDHFEDCKPHQDSTDTHKPIATSIVYEDCQDAYSSGLTKSGVQQISPDGQTQMEVFCDQESSNGGWIVIQRRLDGMVDFARTWSDYKRGFGTAAGEHYLGNDNINLITTSRHQKLRVELHHHGHGFAYAEYSSFMIGPEDQKYQLHLGNYTGTDSPGDSLTYHNKQFFSTRDQDNDDDCGQCTHQYGGGWWYQNCSSANLNGIYGSMSQQGITWNTWMGSSTSLTSVKIMVKPTRLSPTNCQDVFNNGGTTSGVYTIYPYRTDEVQVYCEQTIDGGGWTVFQSRMDGSVSFDRTWNSYKTGFGNVCSEHWLGNDMIHVLTRNKDQRLIVELQHGNDTAYAHFSNFYISDETNKYQLHVSGFSNGLNNPGDSLAYHNGMYYSTKDRDNDQSSSNLAVIYKGAWWYKTSMASNLNSLYGNTYYRWRGWSGHIPLTASRMMITTK